MKKRKYISRILILMLLCTLSWGLTSCGNEEKPAAEEPVAEEQLDQDEAKAKAEDKEQPQEKQEAKPVQKQQSSGSSASSKPAQPVQQTCSITINGWGSRTVNYQSGDTVYSILQRSGAPIQTENSVYGIYIVGINGLKEGDKGAGSGWTYTVNGETIWASADKATVNPGDSIVWSFVTNGF
ncbi:MAG: DUF4430 domain-containing protein [Clostridiales bacterium]|nr:DUF4430 domain-containing protein [Candidatus Crickella merdequi]